MERTSVSFAFPLFCLGLASDGSGRGRPMTGGAVWLVPFRLFTLSHKTLTQASRFTGLPLHFLVVGFVAAPFFAAYHPRDSRLWSPYPSNRNSSPPGMDDDVQQYERHALPTYDRDRLCVSFRLLSPTDVPATQGAISL